VPKMVKIGSFLTELFKKISLGALGPAGPLDKTALYTVQDIKIRFALYHRTMPLVS